MAKIEEETAEIRKKTEEAITTPPEPPKAPPKQLQDPAQLKRIREIQEQATAAAIGGATLGLFGGVLLDVSLSTDLADLDIPAAVPPIALVIVIGGGTFLVSNNENSIANVIRNILGGATKSVGSAIGGLIKATIDNTAN